MLVVGGSLGAAALNETVPQALARLEPEARPIVVHQAGERQIEALRAAYARVQVEGELRPFIDDMAAAYADADLVICRAGALTVAELPPRASPACSSRSRTRWMTTRPATPASSQIAVPPTCCRRPNSRPTVWRAFFPAWIVAAC